MARSPRCTPASCSRPETRSCWPSAASSTRREATCRPPRWPGSSSPLPATPSIRWPSRACPRSPCVSATPPSAQSLVDSALAEPTLSAGRPAARGAARPGYRGRRAGEGLAHRQALRAHPRASADRRTRRRRPRARRARPGREGQGARAPRPGRCVGFRLVGWRRGSRRRSSRSTTPTPSSRYAACCVPPTSRRPPASRTWERALDASRRFTTPGRAGLPLPSPNGGGDAGWRPGARSRWPSRRRPAPRWSTSSSPASFSLWETPPAALTHGRSAISFEEGDTPQERSWPWPARSSPWGAAPRRTTP